MRVLAVVLLASAMVSSAATSAAAPPVDPPQPWATVNVCDTAARPDVIGIRGSIPGIGRPADLGVRLRVQYRDPATRVWRFVARGADSGPLELGRSRAGRLEAGYDFRLRPPEGTGTVLLRGHVTFTWRRGRRLLREVARVTEGGHPGTRGADPPEHSAAACRIS